MKFQSLKVERFGSLADFELEFQADAPMQILFGPNEAGKSTLLGLIRELLFGFPHSGSPYHYSGTGRQIAAEARLVMADHTTIHFRREKGVRNQQVHGNIEPAGEEIDDATLLRRLGGVSQPFYENVFGFSLGELTSGEKSLEEANLDEALYGTGLGGLRGLQAIQSELSDERDKLWRARGQKQRINELLLKVKESGDQLRAATLRPEEYQARLDRHRQAEEALEKIRAENETSRRTLKHLERLRDALGPHQELISTRRRLEKLQEEWGDSLTRFPHEGRRKMDDLLREIHNAEERLAEADQQIAEAMRQIESLDCAPTLLEQEPAIRQLVQTLTQTRDYRETIPKREQELDSIQRQVLATINEIDPSWTIESLDRYHVSLDCRTRIQEMIEEFQKLQEQRAMNDERRSDRRKDLDTSLARLDAIDTGDESTELVVMIDQHADYVADQRKRQELEERIDGVHWKVEEASRKLFCVGGLDHEELNQLTVPLVETVREFEEELKGLESEVHVWRDRFYQAEEELRQLRADLDEVEASGSIPSREKLDEARALRDQGWELLRRHYADEDKVPSKQFKEWILQLKANDPDSLLLAAAVPTQISALSAADFYELAVTHVDQIADERQRKAEQVTKMDNLNKRIAMVTRRHDENRKKFEVAETTRDETLSRWRTIWEPCNIDPRSPEEMLRWLENYSTYLGLLGDAKKIETQAETLDRRLEEFQERLHQVCMKNDLLAENLSEEEAESLSVETLFAAVKQHVDQCRESQVKRQEIQNRLPELEGELKQLDDTGDEFASQIEQWNQRWLAFLKELKLPTEWTPKMADVTLSRLHEARREYQKVGPMQSRLDEIRAEVEQFDSQTRKLCGKIAEDLLNLPAEQAVETLHARLEAAKGAAIQKQNVTENREGAERHKATIQTHLDELRAGRVELLQAAGIEMDAEATDTSDLAQAELDHAFYEAADRAETDRALLAEIRSKTEQIDQFITGEEEPDAFRKELEAIDPDTFELELAQAKEEDERISSQREQAASEKSLAAEALKELDQTDRASRASVELESHRSELREAVDRWATLSVAQSLIEDAIRRFERENQPEMLKDIQRLFSVMTAGRYIEVRRRMDQEGTLVVIQQDGHEKVPAQLSTGTREQLYLAMRLAYVIHYCRRCEPLPLVMDDVLVNFDAARAAGTIDALAEVARSTQIIFLTCHRHTIDLIGARLPDVSTYEIDYSL